MFIVFVCLWVYLASFIQHNNFESHSYYWMFHLFMVCSILLCDRLRLTHSTEDEHVGYFQSLPFRNKGAMNTLARI